MIISTESVWQEFADNIVQEHQDAIVYADFDQETVLHEGELRILVTGGSNS